MTHKVGVRVVRGPDWKWQSQDGGEGCVGTVISVTTSTKSSLAVVRWDSGVQANYRLGGNCAYDLRMLDNAPAGVKHQHVKCDECKENNIAGIRWKCGVCHNYDLCSPCYMADKHDINHSFMRIVEPGCSPVGVPQRKSATKLDVTGLFPGALVTRGPDWKWLDQDGGAGKTGKVIEISPWSAASSRSAVRVVWDVSGHQDLYRLGHDGKVDVQGKTCHVGGKYYRDHLPCIGEVSQPDGSSPSANAGNAFAIGDKVSIAVPVETLKTMQEGHGGWIPEMSTFIGETGIILSFTELGNVRVQFGTNARYTFHPGALAKAAGFVVDDMVKMIADAGKAKVLQEGHGGWTEKMAQALGHIGKVEAITTNGDLKVDFNGTTWILNPDCCVRPTNADLDSPGETGTSSGSPTVFEMLEALKERAAVGKAAQHTVFKANDIVTIINDMAQVIALQKGHGGWNDRMATAIGKTGKVIRVDSDGDLVVRVNGSRWTLNPACCAMATESEHASLPADDTEDLAEMLAGRLLDDGDSIGAVAATLRAHIAMTSRSQAVRKDSKFKVNDIVTVTGDIDRAIALQKGHGGWNDRMMLALGKIGRVVMVDSDGDVRVEVGGTNWLFNPDCLTSVQGSKPGL